MASSAAKTRDQVAIVFHLRFDWLRSGLSFLDQSQCTVEEKLCNPSLLLILN